MPISYDTDASITTVFNELIGDEKYNEFNSLRDNDISFKVVSKSKITKDDELVSCGGHPAEAKKVSDLHRVFLDAHYIIVVDAHAWREADATRQKAMLHRALMGIKAEVKSNGDLKLGSRKPDVAEFSATISRFGATTPEIESFVDTLKAAVAQVAEKLTSGKLSRAEEDEIIPDPEAEEEEGEEEEEEVETEPLRKHFTKPVRQKKKVHATDDDEPPSTLADDEDEEDALRPSRVRTRRTTPLRRSNDDE